MSIPKHLLLILVTTIIIVLAWSFVHLGLQNLLHLHGWIIHGLGQILAKGQIASLLKKILGLLIIPLGVGCILERSVMPYLIHIVWAIWLILVVAVACQ